MLRPAVTVAVELRPSPSDAPDIAVIRETSSGAAGFPTGSMPHHAPVERAHVCVYRSVFVAAVAKYLIDAGRRCRGLISAVLLIGLGKAGILCRLAGLAHRRSGQVLSR